MWSSSLTCNCLARFARSPFTSTLPVSIAVTASARVLKKRAAQSHLSSRTRTISSELILALPAKRLPRQEDKGKSLAHGELRASGRLVNTTKKDRTRVGGTSAGAFTRVQKDA